MGGDLVAPEMVEGVEGVAGEEMLRELLVDAEAGGGGGADDGNGDGDGVGEVFMLEAFEDEADASRDLSPSFGDGEELASHDVFEYLSFGPDAVESAEGGECDRDRDQMHSQQDTHDHRVRHGEYESVERNSMDFSPYAGGGSKNTSGCGIRTGGEYDNTNTQCLSHSHSISRRQSHNHTHGPVFSPNQDHASPSPNSALLSMVSYEKEEGDEKVDMDMDMPLVVKSKRRSKNQHCVSSFKESGLYNLQTSEGRGKDGKVNKKKKKKNRKKKTVALEQEAGIEKDTCRARAVVKTDPIICEAGEKICVADKELLLLKPKKTRKKAKFESPVASRFCHVCSRTPKNVRLAVCMKITDGVCRKVICEKCFDEYKYGDFEHAYTVKDWLCPHCSGICPERAQCRTYSRINDKLRVTRLKQPKQPRKPPSKRSVPRVGIASRLPFATAPSYSTGGPSQAITPVSYTSVDHVSCHEIDLAFSSSAFAPTMRAAELFTSEERTSDCGTPVSSMETTPVKSELVDTVLDVFDLNNLPTQEQLQALVMDPELADVLIPTHPHDVAPVHTLHSHAAYSPVSQGLSGMTARQNPSIPCGSSLRFGAIADDTPNEDELNPAYYPPLSLDPHINEFTNPTAW